MGYVSIFKVCFLFSLKNAFLPLLIIKPIFHRKTQKKHRDGILKVNVTNFGQGLQENGSRYQDDFFGVEKFDFSTI